MLKDFVRGIQALGEGVRLVAEPGLRRFVVIPFLVNVVVFAGAIVFAWNRFDAWLETLLPDWLAWAEFLLLPLLVLLLLLIVFFTFTFVANFLAGPFNGRLAEKVEARLTGRAPASADEPLMKSIVRDFGAELRRLVYTLAWMVPILVLSFIPVLNLLAFALGAWLLATEYADYPMGNHGIRFSEQRQVLKRRRAAAMGFGAALTLMTLVPVLNFLAMPAGVAGATVLWVREFAEQAE